MEKAEGRGREHKVPGAFQVEVRRPLELGAQAGVGGSGRTVVREDRHEAPAEPEEQGLGVLSGLWGGAPGSGGGGRGPRTSPI